MDNIVNFNSYKFNQALFSLEHPSSEEAIYDSLRESVRVYKLKMDEEGLLAYVSSIHSLKIKQYLLVLASTFGLDGVAIKLIGEGINPNMRDPFGLTALMNASAAGHLNVIKTLIEAGAEVNFHDYNGYTALMYGFWWNHYNVVKYLLDQGADSNIASLDGIFNSSLLMCKKAENTDKALAIIELLLQRGVNIDKQDRNGNTALMTAVHWDRIEFVNLFLKYGANTELRDNDDQTVLTKTIYTGKLDIINSLLAGSCDINSQNIDGETPLIFAINHGKINIAKLWHGSKSGYFG
jgi:uncharacterized protein